MKHLLFTTSLVTLTLSAGLAQANFIGVGGANSIDGSLCVGNDCVADESFGFDTIRMKENNVRLNFTDTSTSASFPNVDWTLEANDRTNGGANYMAIVNVTNNRTPFKVDAGAGTNALIVDGQGDVGIGEGTPVVELHVSDGDSPTLRLEQDGSSGFATQTWDLAGNETNFFIRDVTNSSRLPFRIRPGAPTSSIDVAADGDVGIGTQSPDAPLEIERSDSFVFFRMTATGGTLTNDSMDVTYTAGSANTGEIRYNIVDGDNQEMALDADGNLTIDGTLTTGGTTCGGGCDLVFTDHYDLPTIEEHHAKMWEQGYLPNVGPTIEGEPFNMTDKLGRMLNELEHAHIFIDRQQEMLKTAQAEIEALKMAQAEQMAALSALQEALAAQ